MFADKGPETSTVKKTTTTVEPATSTVEPKTSNVSGIVNNGMLINFIENQRAMQKYKPVEQSNIGHKRHIAKTKKTKLIIPKAKQMSNTDPTKSWR